MNIAFLRQAGIDTDEVMQRFQNDEDLYKQVLRLFLDNDIAARLHSLLQAQNQSELFICAHELKGLSANLGMTALCETSTRLSDYLRDCVIQWPMATRMCDTVQQAYCKTIDAIKQALSDE